MQLRTVINKNIGKYRTTNEIQESTGQLQKYRNLQDRWDHCTGAAAHSSSSLDAGIYKTRDLAQNQPLRRLTSLHSAMYL